MKKLVVLGGGESGVGAAILGKKKGWDVFLSDKGSITEAYKDVLLKFEVPFEEQKHSLDKIHAADIVVKSPGIPDHIDLIQTLHQKDIPVISEIEWGARFTNAKLIGITGSNGKTTTTSLIYHLLKSAGFNVGLAGNIGDSFAKQVALENYDYFVLEISSFQLDGMYETKLDIGVLTNITPDHLDRYNYEMANYVNSKFRITRNMADSEVFIYGREDVNISKYLEGNGSPKNSYSFGIQQVKGKGARLEENQLVAEINNRIVISVADLPLKGQHNWNNIMAALLVASSLNISEQQVTDALKSFKAIPHRLEPCGQIENLKFINDSKATNVDAVKYALDAVDDPIVWVVGGVDKGNDYSELNALVDAKVKGIICLGKDNKKLLDFYGSKNFPISEAGSAEEAVQQSLEFKGNIPTTVLLSPACASFDLFKNYEDRGNKFKEAINKLNRA
jgi:UDP-N-acetylmuramoylalanine--D-glutamate ligase